jgi:hypothetical protein
MASTQYHLDVLRKIKESLEEANESEHETIADTIWVAGDGAYTLFDYIDVEIEKLEKELEKSPNQTVD